MKHDDHEEVNYLLQTDLKGFVLKRLGKEAWVTVYSSRYKNNSDVTFFSALIPNAKVEEALQHQSWDLSIGGGLPGFARFYEDGTEKTEYERFSSGDIEPLVISRDFHKIKPSYLEILEEFRLFHNLYHDTKTNSYIKIDDDGDEEEVLRVSDEKVEVKLFTVRQYLAAKDMHLAIFLDSVRYSTLKIGEVGEAERHQKLAGEKYTFAFDIADAEGTALDGHKSFSKLVGKKLIPGLDKNIWPFDETEVQNYVEFIIGTGEDSNKELHTCDPDKLDNYFGKNPGAPHYLTPVFFRREVLTKYYANPEKYSVEDGCIRCGGLWLLRVDNDIDGYVSAFLGDLGRDLSHNEQMYWRNFNVVPDRSISRTNFQRSFLGEFAEPERADLLLKYRLELLGKAWNEKYQWPLLLPLAPKDRHYLDSLRIPLNNSQAEFDDQVLGLTKVLVDFLNESELNKALTGLEPNTKGISKLEKFLNNEGCLDAEKIITFFRGLQDLRSTGIAHRKGKNYEKLAKKLDLDAQSLIKFF